MGQIPGSIGETSTLMVMIGGAGADVDAHCVLSRDGTLLRRDDWLDSLVYSICRFKTNPMFGMSWYWHMVVGGFAFGMMYMATDPGRLHP